MDSDERESEEEEDEAICMDDIRVVQVDDGECEIYEGNFDDDDEEEEGEELAEEEVTAEEEETEKEKEQEEFACDVVEVELGDDHVEDAEMEERTEEKEESASVDAEKAADCEVNTDSSIRDGTGNTETTEEAVTDTKWRKNILRDSLSVSVIEVR